MKIILLLLFIVFSGSGNGTYVASAYCLKGKTATGKNVRTGIVAADPRVLPLGTRIAVNGTPYTVADTGGAIKGRRLDIWMPSCKAAINYGKKKVQVKVLTKGQ